MQSDPPHPWQNLIASAARNEAARAEKERVAARREFLEKISAVNFDKAATFMSLVIGGGFAGMFAIWGWVASYLARWQTLSIAMLLAASLTIFVVWQVYTMVTIALQQMEFAKAVLAKDADFDVQLALTNKKNLATAAVLMKLWPYAVAAIATPAAIGALLLIFACAAHLLTGAKAPELIQV